MVVEHIRYLGGREQGFRRSAGYRTFYDAVEPSFEQIEEMRHYELTPMASAA
jgi:hypothetical protein